MASQWCVDIVNTNVRSQVPSILTNEEFLQPNHFIIFKLLYKNLAMKGILMLLPAQFSYNP